MNHRALPWILVMATLACTPSLEVEVDTAIGSRARRDDPAARAQDVSVMARALFGRDEATGEAELPALAGPVHPPRAVEELDDLVVAIRKGALDEIGGPAHRLQHAEASLWPQLRALLLAPRRAPKGDYRSTLAAIGGDVPNRYGHFDLAWKKAHGFATKLSEDWFEDLLVMPRSKLSPSLVPVYRDCVLTTALLQAASEIGKNPGYSEDVVNVLLEAAYVHEGTFRDEVGRAVARIGDEAVPWLLRRAIPPQGRDPEAAQRAAYAQALLDRMDRWIPERAEAALRAEPRRLAAALTAWGEARDGHAAPVMLAHVDSKIPSVRAAARAAFVALVEGPPPKSVSRRVRLLGGGTGHAQAYLNYRQLAALAVRDAIVRLDPQLLEAPCDLTLDPRGRPLDPTCEQQPARHAEAYFAALDTARASDTRRSIALALAAVDRDARVAALDRLLAERPELGDAPVLVEAYREAAAAALQDGDAAKTAALSRKASVLVRSRDPELADTLQVQALLAEATLPALPEAGREMLLRTAAGLRPDDPHVDGALAGLARAQPSAPELSRPRIGLGVALVGLAFACLVALRGLGRRRPQAV